MDLSRSAASGWHTRGRCQAVEQGWLAIGQPGQAAVGRAEEVLGLITREYQVRRLREPELTLAGMINAAGVGSAAHGSLRCR